MQAVPDPDFKMNHAPFFDPKPNQENLMPPHQYVKKGLVRSAGILLLALAVALPGGVALAQGGSRPNAFSGCANVTEIPVQECSDLLALYDAANGPDWTYHDNWQENDEPCTWYGVGCNAGHVQELQLWDNHLTGTLPDLPHLQNLEILDVADNQLGGGIPGFSHLVSLQYLRLSNNRLHGQIPGFAALTNLEFIYAYNNQLGGPIPSSLCALPLTEADFGYNKLDIYNTDPCIDGIDEDWQDTQTAPPRNLQLAPLSGNEVNLSWDIIPYTGNGGYYEVRWGETAGGPYAHMAQTSSKTVNQMTIADLAPGHTYYFAIRTFTPSHGEQQNALTSADSPEALALLADIAVSGADITLTWTPAVEFASYEILYSVDFYFQPDDPNVTAETSTTGSWTHAGAAADVTHNYGYLLRGVYGDGSKTGVFNRTGEFSFGLTPGG